jgi:hypothetical protein
MYQLYKAKGGKVDRQTFVTVLKYHNSIVIDLVIQTGETYLMPLGIGGLDIVKRYRSFNTPSVNWAETKKLGTVVYYTDDFAVRYRFRRGTFKNRRYFTFRPARGVKGAVNLRVQAIKENPLLLLKYNEINNDL